MKLNKKEVGERIRQARKNRGLTQEELGELLNIHLNTISAWENGVFLPKTLILHKLAQVLNVTEAELLNGPQDNTWTLEIKFDNSNSNSNKELIDMVGDMPCISSITGTAKGAVLTLSGKWDTFRDDAKFQDFIDQLVKARDKILRLGEDWTD